MDNKEIYDIMINEYKEYCHDYYEGRYGIKINASYTIENKLTGEVLTGSVSGCRHDKTSEEVMISIRRMMKKIFGDQVTEDIRRIKKEIRAEEKAYFEENPQHILCVTAID